MPVIKNSDLFVCFCCFEQFEERAFLRKHIGEAHPGRLDETFLNYVGPTGSIWHCRYCLVPLRGYQARKDHESRHTNEQRFPCRIDGCSKWFRTCSLRKLHETGKHKIYLLYCHHCGALFENRKELEQHEEIAHSWEPQKFYVCTICDAKCRSLDKLQKHEEYKHFPVSKIFHCPIEDCKFFHFIKTKRDDHYRLAHSGEEAFKCRFPGCEKKFLTQQLRLSHERTSHKSEQRSEDPSLFPCTKCRLVCFNLRSQKIHEASCDGIFRPGMKRKLYIPCVEKLKLKRVADPEEEGYEGLPDDEPGCSSAISVEIKVEPEENASPVPDPDPDPDRIPDAVNDVLRMMEKEIISPEQKEKKSKQIFACYAIPADCSVGTINGRLHLVKKIDVDSPNFAAPLTQLAAVLSEMPPILFGPNFVPSVNNNDNNNVDLVGLMTPSNQLSNCFQISR